jgi:hypothetical protein
MSAQAGNGSSVMMPGDPSVRYLRGLSIREMQRDRGTRWALLWTWIAWEPSMTWLREDSLFFALMEETGVVQLWEARGYPPAYRRVRLPGGDRLGC